MGPKALAAPDKFRGTASAPEVAAAMAAGASRAGWRCDTAPVADGGEGTLDALGGANRSTRVSGPLGDPVEADWRLRGDTAVVEMARASGLTVAGGAEANDPVSASTYGTGELIQAAIDAGARRIIVGVGGSATTDGGLGAVRALTPVQRLGGVELLVACDVRTRFLEAPETFAPQKGASSRQVRLLRNRLERVAQMYLEEYGVDVCDIEGSGAAGGLAGGLAAIGAELVSGFDLVAEEIGLRDRMADADLVLTGEGFLDRESFEGKSVGGVVGLAAELDVPVVAVVGAVYDQADRRVETVALVDEFGPDRSMEETLACVEEATCSVLTARTSP